MSGKRYRESSRFLCNLSIFYFYSIQKLGIFLFITDHNLLLPTNKKISSFPVKPELKHDWNPHLETKEQTVVCGQDGTLNYDLPQKWKFTNLGSPHILLIHTTNDRPQIVIAYELSYLMGMDNQSCVVLFPLGLIISSSTNGRVWTAQSLLYGTKLHNAFGV